MNRIWELVLRVASVLAPKRPEARKAYERQDPEHCRVSKSDRKRHERSGWESGQVSKIRPKGKAGY